MQYSVQENEFLQLLILTPTAFGKLLFRSHLIDFHADFCKMEGNDQSFRACKTHVNMLKEYVQKFKAKVIFHTFLSSLVSLFERRVTYNVDAHISANNFTLFVS